MLRAILVDNEQTIREGIRDSVDWKKLGITVEAEAGDGQSALRLVNELLPNILITDIKMPYMDGLKLSELALKACPGIKIVLISGFDDFKFAQRGIQLGVAGYILKPVKKTELEELLGKIVAEERSGKSERTESRHSLNVNIDMLMLEKYFRSIIFGKRGKAESLDMQKKLMGEKKYFFVSAIVQLDNYMRIIRDMTGEEQSALAKELFNVCDGYFAGIEGVVGMPSDNYTYMLFMYNERDDALRECVSRYALQLKMVMQNSDMSASMAIGGIYEDSWGLKRSFEEAKTALRYRFVMGDNSTLYYSDIERTDSADAGYFEYSGADRIMEATMSGNKQEVRTAIDSTGVQLMAAKKMTRAYLTMLVSDIYRSTMDFLETIDVSMDEIFENPMRLYSLTMEEQTVRGTADSLYNMLSSVMDYVALKKQGRFSNYIDKAKRYIEEHYNESDINLEKIAGKIQMSVSYFSIEFKRSVGKTYIEFLTEIRIKKAKELLLGTSLKVYEIAEMIGYDNPTYFNYLFKQTTGMSPGQFRKSEGI